MGTHHLFSPLPGKATKLFFSTSPQTLSKVKFKLTDSDSIQHQCGEAKLLALILWEPTKVFIVKVMVFPVVKSSCWELNQKQGRAWKNGCFWTLVLEKTSESPLYIKEIKPVNLKGNQPWILIGRTDAESPILWPPDAKSWLIGKILMLGKIKGRRRGQQRLRWLDAITCAMDMNLGKLWEMVRDREAWCAAVQGIVKRWTQLGDWTTLRTSLKCIHANYLQ